jgi:hypothetical protein
MDLRLAIHTAARRFCADQHYRWSVEYMALCKSGLDRVKGGYSERAYELFPRYRLDQAIEVEVERLTGFEFQSLEEARKLVLEAGQRALSSMSRDFQQSGVAGIALNEEFREFNFYVTGLGATQLNQIELLPYRRVLGESDSKQVRQKLRARWNVNGYWFPLAECDPRMNIIAFHEELWNQRDGTYLLHQAMQERAIDRCFLLREGPTDYEIDRSLIKPSYDGLESFLTSDFEWLVYCSHESSITVAGWLADFFQAKWPDWTRITYQGPFHTDDLRGSWTAL